MILEPIRPQSIANEVALDHWRGVLERALERHAIIDWYEYMNHPQCAFTVQQVLDEAGMLPYGSELRFRYQCGPKTLDWLMGRKGKRL